VRHLGVQKVGNVAEDNLNDVEAAFLDYELMVESSLVAISTACVFISVYLPANKAKPGHMVFSSAAQPIGRGWIFVFRDRLFFGACWFKSHVTSW
jgi:hypothetical protein